MLGVGSAPGWAVPRVLGAGRADASVGSIIPLWFGPEATSQRGVWGPLGAPRRGRGSERVVELQSWPQVGGGLALASPLKFICVTPFRFYKSLLHIQLGIVLVFTFQPTNCSLVFNML